MDGIILFADDDVLNSKTQEYKLFQKFNTDDNYAVLPITNLIDLEKIVPSVSTFRALILDWNFKRQEVGMPETNENPLNFLESRPIYTLVYIYSREDISGTIKERLNCLYPNKVFFEKKSSDSQEDVEYAKICKGISDFETSNKHMSVPFIWSQAINQSAQTLFAELEQAAPDWVKEIYKTAENDNSDPNSEVISVFNNLLIESVVQNESLINVLSEFCSETTTITTTEQATAKLYRRIYYTKLNPNAPLMTGDIFKFADNEFGILITPECEIDNKKNKQLEFLIFDKNDFNDFLCSKKGYTKSNYAQMITKNKQSIDLKKQFNNESQSCHIIPSFPFDTNIYNSSVYIDFKKSFALKSKEEFDGKRIEYKLNSPYIFQLRQRYISFLGKIGVPAIPDSLRSYNLK